MVERLIAVQLVSGSSKCQIFPPFWFPNNYIHFQSTTTNIIFPSRAFLDPLFDFIKIRLKVCFFLLPVRARLDEKEGRRRETEGYCGPPLFFAAGDNNNEQPSTIGMQGVELNYNLECNAIVQPARLNGHYHQYQYQ